MPKIKGSIFDTPKRMVLSVPAPGPQELTIAAAHQREATLHQTDGPIAQVVGFPGTIWDALLAEHRFGDGAICTAGTLCIERANSLAQAFAPLF